MRLIDLMCAPAVNTPPNCSGPWSECHAKYPDLAEAQWYRGQMRGWAGYWRRRHELAALLGQSVAEMASTHLSLAKTYRDGALKLEGRV